ncbi:MAG: ATPase, T2SS/T4P/T4SS family, partial [Kangiellaceae bacterium]
AMREAPDVILIGEIRDRATMKQALTYAETGHLCLATLHANNANLALERVFNFFPEEAKAQILQDVALNLRAIVAQRLCLGLKKKRVAAVEMMQVTPFIKELIEFGKIDEIKDAMERTKGRVNQTFDQSLYDLVKTKKVSLEEALRKADSKNNLALKFRLEKGAKEESDAMQTQGELVIDKDAPFEHYNTYKIQPLTVRARSERTKQKINTAIMMALNDKGLRLVEGHADLEVQYVLGIKVEEGLRLEPISGQRSNLKSIQTPDKEMIMLMINIIDNQSQKPVFRVTASKKKALYEENQGQLNKGLASLLVEFPVGVSATEEESH